MDKRIAAITASGTGTAHTAIRAIAPPAGVGFSILAFLRAVAATGASTAIPTGLQGFLYRQAGVVQVQ